MLLDDRLVACRPQTLDELLAPTPVNAAVLMESVAPLHVEPGWRIARAARQPRLLDPDDPHAMATRRVDHGDHVRHDCPRHGDIAPLAGERTYRRAVIVLH